MPRHASSRSRHTLVTLFFWKKMMIYFVTSEDKHLTFIMTRNAFVTLSSRFRHAMKSRQIQDLFWPWQRELKFEHRHTRKMPRHALVTL